MFIRVNLQPTNHIYIYIYVLSLYYVLSPVFYPIGRT